MSEIKDTRADYPEKYWTLLDDEMWDFINRTAHFYGADAVNWSIEQQRESYDELCRAFTFDHPTGMETVDEMLEHDDRSVGLRHYTPASVKADTRILYIHGGGFVVGGLDSHDSICADISDRTGLRLTAVDYALAPEHNYPADFEDCLFAYETLSARWGEPVILVGDSAGGNLCAAVCHANETATQPVGQVLIYPGLGSDIKHGSFIEHAHAPGLTQADTRFYKTMRVRGNLDLLEQETCCPLNARSYRGLPATRIHTADCDPLRDDGADYALKLEGAGGDVQFTNWAGLIHGHLRARQSSARAKACFDAIVEDVRALAGHSG